jgi:catechol 2,3-dioxygenase-like lactoylglutathione lyase family enzyme
MMTPLSFDHVHYRSSDFRQSRHFYVDIMGAVDLGPVELGGKANLQFVLAGVTLLLAPAGDDPAPPVPADKRLGAYHIAFLVKDCGAATEYYRKRGADVAIEPFMAASNIRASFLSAPDGMLVELKQIVSQPQREVAPKRP